MISQFLITILYGVVSIVASIFSVLPDVSLPVEISNAVNSISPYYQGLDTIFPMSTIFFILSIELVFIGFYFSYKIVRWSYTKIPGIN